MAQTTDILYNVDLIGSKYHPDQLVRHGVTDQDDPERIRQILLRAISDVFSTQDIPSAPKSTVLNIPPRG
jgi:hypothetical protein